MTFGHDNKASRLEFDAGHNFEDIGLDTDINFLVRTNKLNGALLYLGDKVNYTCLGTGSNLFHIKYFWYGIISISRQHLGIFNFV